MRVFAAVPGLIAILLCTAVPLPASAGDYSRVILVSWDGVRRDVLLELLEVADPSQPCWEGGSTFPMDTGRTGADGASIFTCLPALAGIKPADAPADSPAYPRLQWIASHTTDDGATMTMPQHAAMLTGCDATTVGIDSNVSHERVPPGMVVYERLMDQIDPVGPDGVRDGHILRTHHSAGRKFVGSQLCYYAKRTRALQVMTGHGNDTGDRPGALRYAERSMDRWIADAERLGTGDPAFFMFLHFKATDWAGHLSGDRSPAYRAAIVHSDRKLYSLLEDLRVRGWEDAAVIVTTDHGFGGTGHNRNNGRCVFNTWIATHNVRLDTSAVPLRTEADYCASMEDPADCLANGPEEPMPPEDVVPNVHVFDIVPTILDMFGVEQGTVPTTGVSLYGH